MSSSQRWPTEAEPDISLTTRGTISPRTAARVGQVIGATLDRHHVEGTTRVRVTGPGCAEGPVLVQVNLRYRESPVRVEAVGPIEFVGTFAAERLDRQICRLNYIGSPRVWPDPARPPLAAVTEPCPIVRRKECVLLVGSPDEAARVMDAMDYDVHLFTDGETGEDAIVFWGGPSGVRLARQYHGPPPRPSATLPLTVHPHAALRLTESEAVARLCRYALPFLFFTDPRDDRGRLLVRRYDANLALVLPAASGGPVAVDLPGAVVS